MYQLIYASSARSLLSEEELRRILEQSSRNNARLGVTGLLLYRGGNLMQLLEGEKEVVRGLYERIQADPRHSDLYVLKEGEVPGRLFEAWAMGFVDMDRRQDLPSYSEFIGESLGALRFRTDGKIALRLFEQFSEMNR